MIFFYFRPPFDVLEVWLESLAMHTSVGHHIPSDLYNDIEHFKESASRESSLSSTPDGLGTPPSTKKTDCFNKKQSEMDTTDSTSEFIPKQIDEISRGKGDTNTSTNSINNSIIDSGKTTDKNLAKDNKADVNVAELTPIGGNDNQLSNFIREIPKSPHLGKDFSPNGDRIRNSIRARRQERMLKQRSLRDISNYASTSPAPSSLGDLSEMTPDTQSASNNSSFDDKEDTSEAKTPTATPAFVYGKAGDFGYLKTGILNTVKRRRSRPYGEKGFIINLNDGLLSLNNVKDLDNCSDDFDSSCDTSLNYTDVNNSTLNDSLTVKIINKLPTPIIETTPTNEVPIPVSPFSNSSDPAKVHKNTLEEIKRQLNLCRTKLEALEIVDDEPQSPSKYQPQRQVISLANIDSISPPKKTTKHENGTPLNNSMDILFSTPKSKPQTKSHSMFSRLNPLSPIFSPKHRGKIIINETYPPAKELSYLSEKQNGTERPAKPSKLFRINDTPIFERRKVHSLLTSKLFKRSGSDDNIMFSPTSYALGHLKEDSPVVHLQAKNSTKFTDTENYPQGTASKDRKSNSSEKKQSEEKTSPLRKYFSVNQSKILPKTRPTGTKTINYPDTIKPERVPGADIASSKNKKNAKEPSTTRTKCAVKKPAPPVVQVHRNNTQRNHHDIYDSNSFSRPKHIFVNCTDSGCSTSTPHTKSAKFTSLFDYEQDVRKMGNDSTLFRIKNSEKTVPTMSGGKKSPVRNVFRN